MEPKTAPQANIAASNDAFLPDLASLDIGRNAEEGIAVDIQNPKTEEFTGLVFYVLGGYAPRFQELLSKASKKEAARAKAGPVASAVAPKDGDEMAEVLAQVTQRWGVRPRLANGDWGDDSSIDWSHLPETRDVKDDDGKPTGKRELVRVLFSQAEAKRVYIQYPIVRQQVLKAATNVASFIKD